MNRLILAYIFIFSCILCACQDIDDIPTSAGKVDADIISLNVTVADNINSDDPDSRALDKGMSTSFEPGDSIGVIILDKKGKYIANNAKYILSDDGEWRYEGLLYKNAPYYNSEMQTYIVYFPYHTSVTEANITSANDFLDPDKNLEVFNHQEDQTTEEAYRYSDVMTWESSAGPVKEIKAELKHRRNSVSLDISVQWKLLTMDPERMEGNEFIDYRDDTFNEGENYDEDAKDYREVITFRIPNEAIIKDKEGNHLKPFQAEDGTFRYILPDGYEGEVTYFYNYRHWMYKNKFEIQADGTGTCYCRVEIADRGVYKYDEVIAGDFYCKNSKNYGFVLPGEAAKYLDNDNHRCIGLVFFTGQHPFDIDGFNEYNYGKTGIAPPGYDYEEDFWNRVECHGYVVALTDAQYDNKNLFAWELDESFNPYDDGGDVGVVNGYDIWSGYFNTIKTLEACVDFDYYKNQFPATYAAYYYGNLVSGTADFDGVKKAVLLNDHLRPNDEMEEQTSDYGEPDIINSYAWQQPLQAPENTTGWFLPANAMLSEVWKYQSLFEQRFEEIKEKLVGEIPYKERIGWVKFNPTVRGFYYYWTSTGYNSEKYRALAHEFSRENYTYPTLRSKEYSVRPVLAY